MQEYTVIVVYLCIFFCFFSLFLPKEGVVMDKQELLDRLERTPVIAAVQDGGFAAALASPAEVVFYLKAHILSVSDRIREAHEAGKAIFVHVELAQGIGHDQAGLSYLAAAGADGIITTRTQLVRQAREAGLLAVQRFFALDGQGLLSIDAALDGATPDLVEIMPGVIGKVIARFSRGSTPVIAGGLIETKKELTAALESGAIAVSTGARSLWNID